jgi:hypothetical protein
MNKTGNRNKAANETMPVTETIRLSNSLYKFRYDFQHIPADDDREESYNYNFVDIPDTNRATIISAIIRTRYTADQESAILRKKHAGEDVIDFVKYRDFVNYAKAAADGLDLSGYHQATVFELIIPFELTLAGGDYYALADYALKSGIPYETDVIDGLAKVYPSWLKPEDQAAIESDPRVQLNVLNTFEE